MKKRYTISAMITIVLIAMTVTFSVTMVAAMRLFDSTVASVKEKESMYSKLAEVDKYARANGYFDIDEETLYDMLASGYLLGTRDRYARYYTAAAYAELLDVQSGKRIGIGVDVVKDSATGYAKVIRVYPGSPAADLGLERGCYITAIDETDVKTISTADNVLARLRGESGTTVTIGWLTTTYEERSDLITRRGYTAGTVEHTLVDERYGYIRILRFDTSTASDLDYAIRTLTTAGATSLVFDLRDNAGGELEAAIECLDLLCPESTIATLLYKGGATEVLGESVGEKTDLPIVCIVNGSTASAAELFAYTVRALNGALLTGEPTAGKGTVQSSPHRLSDGSAVVITVGKLLCCDGSSFDGVGLAVDVERTLTADELIQYYDFTMDNDPQILRAFSAADSLTGEATAGAVSESAVATATATPAPEDEPGGEEGDEGDEGTGEEGEGGEESEG